MGGGYVTAQHSLSSAGLRQVEQPRSGRPRALRPDFSLQLDSSIDAVVNKRVCQGCYERHTGAIRSLDGRVRKLTTTSAAAPHLDELAAVAIGDLSPPPLPPPPPLAHLSLLPPSPAPPLLSTIGSSPPTVPPAPFSSPPHPLSDITNTPLRSRRHSTPLKRKRQLVEEATGLTGRRRWRRVSGARHRSSRCVRESPLMSLLRRSAGQRQRSG